MSEMGDPQAPASDAAPLQFERAEYDTPSAGAQCTGCKNQIHGSYWALHGQTLCNHCKAGVEQAFAPGSAFSEVTKAVLFGLGGGLAGSAVWYIVLRTTNYEVGLIAILVGYLAGMGVNKAIRGRGGRGYQVLAALITYACICWARVPLIADGLMHREAGGEPIPGVAAWLISIVFSLGYPFFAGFDPLGWFIAAIGVYEAWRRNRKVNLTFEGPFLLAPAPAPAVATVAAAPSASPEGSGEPLL